MRDFYKMLETIQNNPDKKFSLATIFRVQGSSYRKAGAKMLIGEDGQHIGTISAGCLEGDLFYHALASMKQKETKIVTYD
ncbi:MAG TPA: XdhC family protein, partial [Bacillota bacterium]|nr:XdhC family protein [Bacillota bacterium]